MKFSIIWLIVASLWILILISYLFSGVDWYTVIFSIVFILSVSAVVDWLISDSVKTKS